MGLRSGFLPRVFAGKNKRVSNRPAARMQENDQKLDTLYLLGVVHLDPEGPRRLKEFLEVTRPRVVTVEVSPYAVTFREERGTELLERLVRFRRKDGSLPGCLPGVEAQLRIPFEFEAARNYCRDVNLIGNSELSKEYLELFQEETMAEENLEKLAGMDDMCIRREVEREWARAGLCWLKPRLLGTVDAVAWREREEALATKILYHGFERRAVDEKAERQNSCVPIVHVGGWKHVHGLERILKGRGVKDLKVLPMLLEQGF